MKLADLLIGRLCLDDDLQMRDGLDEGNVTRLVEILDAGGALDPIEVIYDGKLHYPTDGRHRIEAHKRKKLKTIRAHVNEGTRRDAILAAAGANSRHGLWRSNADKRRAVETLVRDEEWGSWSDRKIADQCGVSHTFVANLRRESSGQTSGNGCQTPGSAASRRAAFDALPPSLQLAAQQRAEEEATLKREGEERKAAEPVMRDVCRIALELRQALVDAIDKAARRAGRNREGEIVRQLEVVYLGKRGRKR